MNNTLTDDSVIEPDFEFPFKLNDDLEILQYGILYFFVALLILPMNSLIILTIYRKDKHKRNITNKLMNLINSIELVQAIGHLVTAPVMVFPNLHVKYDVLVRIAGCIINTFWIADLPVMSLLAVSRILLFCQMIRPEKFNGYIRAVLFLIFSWILFVLVYGCIAQNLTFTPPVWGYDFEVPYTYVFDTLELCLSFPCLAVSYVSYLAIIYLIYVKKRTKSSSHQSRKNEIAIMVQYTFVTLYINFIIILWHPNLFTLISFIDMDNRRNQAISNALWIAHCYVNPVLMMVFNKSIREDCFNMICKSRKSKKNNSMAPTVTAVRSQISML